MKNKELIQQRLIEQGVPKDLAECNFNFLSKLIFLEEKPLVFQSPYKAFFKQGLVSGILWGGSHVDYVLAFHSRRLGNPGYFFAILWMFYGRLPVLSNS